jgi:hypothetical protein
VYGELTWGTATRVTACSGNRQRRQQQESQPVQGTDLGNSNKSHCLLREQTKRRATRNSMICLISLRELALGTTTIPWNLERTIGTAGYTYHIKPQAPTFGTVGDLT